MNRLSTTFSEVMRCPASPTGWIELRDDSNLQPDSAAALTAAELLARSDVRVFSDSAEAEFYWDE